MEGKYISVLNCLEMSLVYLLTWLKEWLHKEFYIWNHFHSFLSSEFENIAPLSTCSQYDIIFLFHKTNTDRRSIFLLSLSFKYYLMFSFSSIVLLFPSCFAFFSAAWWFMVFCSEGRVENRDEIQGPDQLRDGGRSLWWGKCLSKLAEPVVRKHPGGFLAIFS